MEFFRNNQSVFPDAKRLSVMSLLTLLAAGMICLPANGRPSYRTQLVPALDTTAPQEVTEPQWAFEVASVKPSKSVDPTRGGLFSPGGRYSAAGIPLRIVVITAYEIDPVRLSGGPDWLDSQGFDIDAKTEAAAIAPGALDRGRLHRLHLMLQALLRDRFKLTVHRETKQGPIYELVVAKGGFELQALKDVDCEVLNPTVENPGCGDFTSSSRNGSLIGPKVEIRDVAWMLPRLMGRPVTDKTGIAGYFNINLRWTIRSGSEMEATERREARPDRQEVRPAAQSLTIFEALEQQLGLRLEAKQGPIEILVIDHVERPSGN
jgi:uncharacterized protein (TIGR03435 family)